MQRSRSLLADYLTSVTGATLAVLPVMVWVVFCQGCTASFGDGVWNVWEALGLEVFYWQCAALTAWGPFLLTRWVASKYAIRNPAYYVVCGGVTGIILLSIVALILLLPRTPKSGDINVFGIFPAYGPMFIFSGICGALIFWYTTGRHLGGAGVSGERL